MIGLGIAGELAGDYETVTVLERDSYCYREASYASGGMLAPFMEVEFQERDVLELNKRSLETYRDFVETLRNQSGVPLDVETQGSLHVALDDVQVEELRRLHDYQERLGLPVHRLTPTEVRKREPTVSREIKEGLYAPDEMHVNNRQLGLALYERCRHRDVTLLTEEPVEQLTYSSNGERIEEVHTTNNQFSPGDVVVAAGAWSDRIPGLRPPDKLPVRPVKGQAVSVRMEDPFLPETVVRSPDFYGVPHYPERFIVGASMEEKGYDTTPTTGHVLDLLDAASRVLPDLKECQLLEFWSGLRPAARDNRPIIGPSDSTRNLYFATGNFRNGILQLPVTIDAIKQYLTGKKPTEDLEPFRPTRFQQKKERVS